MSTSIAPGYSMKMSLAQISSWHGTRNNSASLHAIRYQASKSGPQQSFSACELRSFYLPFTIPNVVDWSSQGSLKNDVFAWSDDGNDYSVVIPASMYDGLSLAAELESLMNDATAPGTYTVVYDPVSGHFSFTTTSGDEITITPNSTFPWLELGFCFNETVTGTSGTLTSTAVANLQGTANLYLSIPELQNGNSAVYNCSSITFIIPVTTASTYTTQWSYQYSAPMKWYTQPNEKTLRDYTIYVFFERAGTLYQLVGDCNSSYELNIAFFSLQI